MSLPMEEITVRVRAVAAGLGESENENRTKFVFITGSVVDDEKYNGEQITAVLYFTDRTQERSIESLLHFGFASDDLSVLADADEQKCSELLPEIVEYVCAPEEYQGNWQLKVKWVNKPGRGKFAPKKKLEGSDLKSFAAQFKGALRNARGPQQPRSSQSRNGSAPKTEPHPNAPEAADDNVPFATCSIDAEPSPIARVIR